jgi:hypothetical protein
MTGKMTVVIVTVTEKIVTAGDTSTRKKWMKSAMPAGSVRIDPKRTTRPLTRGKRGVDVVERKRLTRNERRDVGSEGRRKRNVTSSLTEKAMKMGTGRNIVPGEIVPHLGNLTDRTALIGHTGHPFVTLTPTAIGGFVTGMDQTLGIRGGTMIANGTRETGTTM